MDPVTTAYYATICAALGYGTGWMRRATLRVLVGALVGVAAAAVLPGLRGYFGI